MIQISERPATALRAVNEPREFEGFRGRLNSSRTSSRLRLQYLASRLHALGPKPLVHFLDEMERGADLIRIYRGNKFGPSVFSIDGGDL